MSTLIFLLGNQGCKASDLNKNVVKQITEGPSCIQF